MRPPPNYNVCHCATNNNNNNTWNSSMEAICAQSLSYCCFMNSDQLQASEVCSSVGFVLGSFVASLMQS